MKIYIVILFIIMFLGVILKPNKDTKRKRIFMFIVFGTLIVVAAIRDISVGVDTRQFCNNFDKIKFLTLQQSFNLRYEKGFIILCKALSYINSNHQILIIASSIIIFFMMGMFIYKNSKDVVFSSILYITLNTYAMHMNVMRQAIAIAIFILGYELFFKKNKFIKYSITVILASLFHQTAIIMLVLILIKDRKYTEKTYLVTNIIAVLSLVLAPTIWMIATSLFPTYAGYAKTEYINSSYLAGTISAIIAWLVLTMGIFFERKNKEKGSTYNFLAYIMSILFIIDVLVIKINLFVRLATYFGIFTCVWLPSTLQNIQDKNEKVLMKYIVLVCFILYWAVLSTSRPEWYGVIPYSTFLNN